MRILALNSILPFGLKHTGYQPIQQVIILPTDPRVVYTGTYPRSERSSLQGIYNNATKLYEERVASAGSNLGNAKAKFLYTNNAGALLELDKILTVNYYDTYDNLDPDYNTLDGQLLVQGNNIKLKGLPVASFARVLGTNNWNINYSFYDAIKIRPVYAISYNHLEGHTKTSTELDFAGKVTKTITKHRQKANTEEVTVIEEFSYDEFGRVLTHTHQINGGRKEYLADNTYNSIGQLMTKKVGNLKDDPYQTVNYKYNVRGWLTDINNVDQTNNLNKGGQLFSFKLSYNELTDGNNRAATVEPKHNGNISQTFWKITSDPVRSYDYKYDGLNRLLDASFYKEDLSGNFNIIGYYDERLTYDHNGNIKNLERYGNREINAPMPIDQLTYNYDTNSNKLKSVSDQVVSTNINYGFIDSNKTGDDYDYDINGNLTKDLNKGITNIVYNHLNLPTEVIWNSTKKIKYDYDATGVKLRKIVTDGSKVTTTDYLGGFQYVNNNLQFFPTAEGYVNVVTCDTCQYNRVYSYVYNYTDHLGNVRTSYTWDDTRNNLKLIESSHYYPFGMKHSGYNSLGSNIGIGGIGQVDNQITGTKTYNYKYNGKELQDEFNINLYDYGARNYDPAIGRWFNVDPLAEKFTDNSTYNYTLNNPIYFIDPTGMSSESNNEDETDCSKVSCIQLDEVVVTAKSTATKVKEEVSNFFNIAFNDIKSIEKSAFKSYDNLFNDPNATKWYLEMHNGKLSKSIDNTINGTAISIVMLPIAVEYGTIILVKYGADVFMQAAISKTFTGEYKVNFINAAIGSVSPGFISPITTEMSDVSQNLINSELKFSDLKSTEFLMSETLKIGTGYIGNGLGKLGEGTSVLGDKASPLINEGLQSFHNNLQSQMITENSKK